MVQSGARPRQEPPTEQHDLRAASLKAPQDRSPPGSRPRCRRRLEDGRARPDPARREMTYLGVLPGIPEPVVHGTVNVGHEPLVKWGPTDHLDHLSPWHRRPTARDGNNVRDSPAADGHAETLSTLDCRQDFTDVIPEFTLRYLACPRRAVACSWLQHFCHCYNCSRKLWRGRCAFYARMQLTRAGTRPRALPRGGTIRRRRLGRRPLVAHALAPVYDRRPSRQNHEASADAASVPATSAMRPRKSTRPAMTCAGTVTATPIGTALDSVTRSLPG